MMQENIKNRNLTNDELEVKIMTPEDIVWEGRASAVSSYNSAGPFDILPEHANIITLIENKPIEVVTAAGSHSYTFERAVLSAKENKVSIYTDILVRTKTPQGGNPQHS